MIFAVQLAVRKYFTGIYFKHFMSIRDRRQDLKFQSFLIF